MKTREQWLNEAVEMLRPRFAPNYTIPPLKVSIGFPPKGGLGRRSKVTGVCFSSGLADDRQPQIYINPTLSEVGGGDGILGTLVHELVHGCGVPGHGKAFKSAGSYIGLEGKMASSTAGQDLQDYFETIIEKLGQFPHSTLHGQPMSQKPDKCRMHKCICDQCGYTVRIANKWINVGVPDCPVCRIALAMEATTEE